MKLEIASVIAMVCCSLVASSSAQFAPTCADFQRRNTAHFQCRTGDQCFVKWYECDSILDCADFSDEDHCEAEHEDNCDKDFEGKTTRDGQPLQSFQCDNRMCILGCHRCDGRIHCADLSDEIGCTGNEVTPPCQ